MFLDGPHKLEVHTLNEYDKSIKSSEIENRGRKETNKVTGKQGQRNEQDCDNGQRPHNLVHLVR